MKGKNRRNDISTILRMEEWNNKNIEMNVCDVTFDSSYNNNTRTWTVLLIFFSSFFPFEQDCFAHYSNDRTHIRQFELYSTRHKSFIQTNNVMIFPHTEFSTIRCASTAYEKNKTHNVRILSISIFHTLYLALCTIASNQLVLCVVGMTVSIRFSCVSSLGW